MSRAEPTVSDVIRVGKVSAVFPERATATVEFKDRDGLVSKELAVMQGNTLKNRDYRLVDVGEHVICAFFGNGLSEGVVLGAIYDRKNDAPIDEQDTRCTIFEDGAAVFYDRKEHVFQIKDSHGSFIQMKDGNITIQSAALLLLNPGSSPIVKGGDA